MNTPISRPAWWTHDGPVERYVRDVLLTEMAQLRPGGWPLPPTPPCWGWHWQTDLGADSLERMALCSALAEAAGVRDPDDATSLFLTPTWRHWLNIARGSLAAHGQQMRFRTSGSSGKPKSCPHALADLMTEMCAMAQVLGPVERIVSAVRSHHIYGFLFTILLPHALGQPNLPVIDLHGQPPLALENRLHPGDLVIGYPDWWQLVGRLQPTLPPGVVGITSTAPCPDEVSQAVMGCGLSRLLHIYGSSETAGIGWREWPDPDYRLHTHWSRVAQEPQQLRRVRSHPSAGTSNARSIVHLPDQMTWLSQDRFMPGPRLDGAVQVGGVNVHLDQVRQRLCKHPAVADAAVRVLDIHGQARLKAFVVPRDTTHTNLATELQTWAQRHLAPASRPVHYTVGAALPRNAMGKAADWFVPEV